MGECTCHKNYFDAGQYKIDSHLIFHSASCKAAQASMPACWNFESGMSERPFQL